MNALESSSFEYADSIKSSQIKIDFLLGGNTFSSVKDFELKSGCGFCCWRGVAIWAWGIWGFPGDGFLGGFGAGAAALAWMGYW